ncbi:MAG: electron transfer flavoprotein subunit alpha/FixB family protein [Ignavibacteriaceae bacterium]|nr:electron transfer flavoprotein subunit alpha/FixB family protein [Ignavibacteriaceae bacterium]
MIKSILVFIEQRDNQIKKSSLEALSHAVKLASVTAAKTTALIAGGEFESFDRVSSTGVNQIIHFQNPDLNIYSPSAFAKLLADTAKENGSDCLLFANSQMGKDLAPRVAARLDAGIAMDCINLDYQDTELVVNRPIFAGKAYQQMSVTTEKKVFTLRPNVFPFITPGPDSGLVIEKKSADAPDFSVRVTEIKKSEGKLDVSEADIIVSGGRGMKGPEHFILIESLAEVLGGAVGASRAVVDAGWRPHNEQVGQTGKTVSPSLYIACGISGAIQHMAGMSSSKNIVAVNKDKDAPIFTVADYGVVGDVFEILPLLTEEIKRVKS